MEQNTQHDIFTDPALVKAKQDDPFFKLINSHWRESLFFVAFVLAGYYVVTNLQRSFYESKVASSDVFQKAQASLGEIVSLERELSTLINQKVDLKRDTKEAQELRNKKLDEAKAKLKAAQDTLSQRVAALGDQKVPYNKLAPLLSLSAAATTDDRDGIKKISEEIISKTDTSITGVLVSELAQLSKARVSLDSTETRSIGLSELVALVNNSKFVSTAAAATLAKVSSSDEERAQAKAAVENLLTRSPQQRDLLAQELKELGIS